MSAFSVENPHDGKTFENYTRFEWGVEVGVVTTFMLRLFVPHEFDMFQFTVAFSHLLVLACSILVSIDNKSPLTATLVLVIATRRMVPHTLVAISYV